ncbi:MAG: phosphatidate cytidylyltransferase [Bacteroidota bacterium]|nr:phosphatidate cytidylyltransferase [Bacteroidota bacterium]MDP4191551.1 phosphatidate cytidylyltransferase [Bacteroidota bacterium]MDP4195676.1 phosphatidate cytidylyltransferase [Bacteroidota bacterium]
MSLGNTSTRILVSVIFIPLIILSSYFGGLFFLTFISAVGLTAYYEFDSMAKNKNSFSATFVGLLSVLSLITDAYFNFVEVSMLVYIIVISIFLFELFRNKNSAILNIGATLLGVFYIGLFSRSIIEIREFFKSDYLNGGLIIIALLISIWLCDSAAFFVGSAIGKHKMFPRVSPKKSWEGAIAGFAFSVGGMVIMRMLFLQFLSFYDALIIGVLVGIIGQMGDLTESLLKRDAGVKDSSNLIPGHGGIFDRFDSLLLSAPAVLLYLSFFVKHRF